MKSTDFNHRGTSSISRLIEWPLLCGVMALMLVQTMPAADDLYENNAIVSYPGTVSFPPVIDATNFVNNGTFTINYSTFFFSTIQPFYETSDTLNYLNSGVMVNNSGFRFDNRSSVSGSRTPSGSFYNPGMISCGSVTNANDIFSGILFVNGFFFLGNSYYPQCLVSATNIASPGLIEMGFGGKAQLAGQNVDLSRSSINIENFATIYSILGNSVVASSYNGANVAGTGITGLNTNYWNPGIYLGANYAYSAFFPIAPFYLDLTNSTSYFDFVSDGTNNVIRTVFIQDTSGSDVTYNVYFGTGGIGFGSGNVTVEWVGSSLDPATGNSSQNYLYLNDDYLRGIATNVFLINGIPDNFTFTASTTPLNTGVAPTAAGFFNVFPDAVVTNRYSYANAQLTGSTVSTTSIPNGSVTNLPGRVEISASEQLDLSLARITGVNYLSLQSTNQFNGSAGALIQSAYSDFNLGVTNGFLSISNLVSPSTPNWSGGVQAWSTRWLTTNSLGGTNDFRVVIIGSQLTPTALAYVQDMVLHGTNSIVISDTMNITRKFSADAENLTLTTNMIGEGATSLAGELNAQGLNVFKGSASLPNLRNLTNNGSIRTPDLVQFSGASNGVGQVSATNAMAATAQLFEVITKRNNVEPKSTVQIGTNIYTFVSSLNNKVPNQVKLAKKFDGTVSNLIAAINHESGAGSKYSSSTPLNPLASAGLLSGAATNRSFVVSAKTIGVYGNDIVARTTSTNLIWLSGGVYTNRTTLAGGAEYVPATTNTVSTPVPYHNFINSGLVSDQGSTIWATNFESSGMFTNGSGTFKLNALTTALDGGAIYAGGDVIVLSDSFVATNNLLQAGKSLKLSVTNLLTDNGIESSNIWVVGGFAGAGLNLPIKPVLGDLLGTTITNQAPAPNSLVANVWAGQDRGATVAGYSNNVAIGRLILNALGSTSTFKFTGASVSNALYVDYLEFEGSLTNGINNSYDFSANLSIGTNIVIYFADAVANGVSIAAKVEQASQAGRNNGRLRWVPNYAGNFSTTAIVYPDGSTNVFNSALVGSTTLDSNGNGINNANDPTPIFISSQVNLMMSITNVPPLTAVIQWNSIPGSTNYVRYTTNLSSSTQFLLTNFVSPSVVPPVSGWPITNTVYDVINMSQPRYYSVEVAPNSATTYGP